MNLETKTTIILIFLGLVLLISYKMFNPVTVLDIAYDLEKNPSAPKYKNTLTSKGFEIKKEFELGEGGKFWTEDDLIIFSALNLSNNKIYQINCTKEERKPFSFSRPNSCIVDLSGLKYFLKQKNKGSHFLTVSVLLMKRADKAGKKIDCEAVLKEKYKTNNGRGPYSFEYLQSYLGSNYKITQCNEKIKQKTKQRCDDFMQKFVSKDVDFRIIATSDNSYSEDTLICKKNLSNFLVNQEAFYITKNDALCDLKSDSCSSYINTPYSLNKSSYMNFKYTTLNLGGVKFRFSSNTRALRFMKALK